MRKLIANSPTLLAVLVVVGIFLYLPWYVAETNSRQIRQDELAGCRRASQLRAQVNSRSGQHEQTEAAVLTLLRWARDHGLSVETVTRYQTQIEAHSYRRTAQVDCNNAYPKRGFQPPW